MPPGIEEGGVAVSGGGGGVYGTYPVMWVGSDLATFVGFVYKGGGGEDKRLIACIRRPGHTNSAAPRHRAAARIYLKKWVLGGFAWGLMRWICLDVVGAGLQGCSAAGRPAGCSGSMKVLSDKFTLICLFPLAQGTICYD